MTCVMTILTMLSVFNGTQWSDVEVTTNSRIVYNMNEQISSKVEMITEDLMKSETISVKCGEEVIATTNSYLKIK